MIGTTARNQTWDSAFAGLCDLHFTTVMPRDPPVQGGYQLASKRPGLQCRVCVAVQLVSDTGLEPAPSSSQTRWTTSYPNPSRMVEDIGIEPMTFCLQNRRSSQLS